MPIVNSINSQKKYINFLMNKFLLFHKKTKIRFVLSKIFHMSQTIINNPLTMSFPKRASVY